MLKRRYGLGSISAEKMGQPQHQMTKSKARTDFDGFFGGKHRLFRGISKRAADCKRIVRVRISFVEPNGPQTRVQAIFDVLRRIVTPTISNDSSTNAAEPDLRLCEFGVEPACFPKQFTSMEVGLSANAVKMPRTLPNQIPSCNVAAMRSTGGQ